MSKNRLLAPPVTISASNTSPNRPSLSLIHPALQSASSPSAVTQMRKMTRNKTMGQFCFKPFSCFNEIVGNCTINNYKGQQL